MSVRRESHKFCLLSPKLMHLAGISQKAQYECENSMRKPTFVPYPISAACFKTVLANVCPHVT